jgi:ABC-type Fe3+-hydroxamate transport system substrate-binding protein
VTHAPAGAGARIVCLVPSITELLGDLGLAGSLVGRTGFCIHPREVLASIPKVGGTKDVKIDRIRELAPTHVVVNVDENRLETVDEIASFRRPWYPTRWRRSTISTLPLLGAIFGREAQAGALRPLRGGARPLGRPATRSTCST